MYLNISPKPGIFLSAISSIASGVISLPVNPVPPVVIITSIFLIFILSLLVSAVASYIPARHISKMKTFRALKYE